MRCRFAPPHQPAPTLHAGSPRARPRHCGNSEPSLEVAVEQTIDADMMFLGKFAYVALSFRVIQFSLGGSPAKELLPLGLFLWYHGLWRRQVWYQRKSVALPRQEKGFRSASGGTPPSLPRLMLGLQHRATKPLPGLTRSDAWWRWG
jgi:hypothetical protein